MLYKSYLRLGVLIKQKLDIMSNINVIINASKKVVTACSCYIVILIKFTLRQ